MVYFYCDACGESLKKNQVEKHRYKCRGCCVVSCVDCGHNFRGSEYESHTKCISEEEKYSGKNYKPKPNANKGEIKQELWTEQVQRAIDKASDPKLQNVLQQLYNYSNIPRKKAKFENFLSNSLHLRNTALISKVWEAISAETLTQECESSENSSDKNAALQDGKMSVGASDQTKPLSSVKADGSPLCEADNTRKSTKRKKDKARHGDQMENCSEDVQMDISSAAGDTSTKSVTKKKKRKHQEDVVDSEVNIVCENGDKAAALAEDSEHRDKKSAKKRKHNGDVHGSCEGTDAMNAGDDLCKQVKTTDADDSCLSEVVHNTKFKWHPAIIGVLQQAPNKQLPVKKLRKKVLRAFRAQVGDGKVYTKEKLISKFTRKLNRCAQLKVHENTVTLLA